MSLMKVFDISGSGMSAQSLRLTTTASNMSNANVVSGSAETTYKPRYPLFSAVQSEASASLFSETPGVKVTEVVESSKEALKRYQPNHPLADKQGYVFLPDVNIVEEMTNMISASRSYQMNAEVLNTTKQLMSKTLQLGQ